MKKIHFLIAGTVLFLAAACGGSEQPAENSKESAPDVQSMYPEEKAAPASNDSKGIGKFKDIQMAATLDPKLAESGQKIYDMKCSACHRLEGDRLVGPSWKGVTSRREPAWILNFITNVDEMLNKDPMAMSQLEECLVRMPNQNLSDQDAYSILEYMRKNDGVK